MGGRGTIGDRYNQGLNGENGDTLTGEGGARARQGERERRGK